MESGLSSKEIMCGSLNQAGSRPSAELREVACLRVEPAALLRGCVSSRGIEQKEHRKLSSLSIGKRVVSRKFV